MKKVFHLRKPTSECLGARNTKDWRGKGQHCSVKVREDVDFGRWKAMGCIWKAEATPE